jgi:hypothetical protein
LRPLLNHQPAVLSLLNDCSVLFSQLLFQDLFGFGKVASSIAGNFARQFGILSLFGLGSFCSLEAIDRRSRTFSPFLSEKLDLLPDPGQLRISRSALRQGPVVQAAFLLLQQEE